jgi:hypothetical protein
MYIPLSKSNKGWHKLWFYLRNNPAGPLPILSGHVIEEAPEMWRYGPVHKEMRRLSDLIQAVETLKAHVLRESRVIGAYHIRRLAPLMACALPMYQMTPDMP